MKVVYGLGNSLSSVRFERTAIGRLKEVEKSIEKLTESFDTTSTTASLLLLMKTFPR